MQEWWDSLILVEKIFYGIGIVASFGLLLETLATVFGSGTDTDLDIHMDTDFDAGHSDHLGVFSLKTITAFFFGFGWAGALVLSHGGGIPLALAAGFGCGSVFLFGCFFLIRSLLGLQDSGTISFKNALGKVGTVYTTLPANRSGSGQIEVMIQGRLMTVEAFNGSGESLKPMTKVKVTELVGTNALLVEPL